MLPVKFELSWYPAFSVDMNNNRHASRASGIHGNRLFFTLGDSSSYYL